MRFLSLFLAVAPVAMASIEFTGPDPSSKLNLSAPITISWKEVGDEDANWPIFDLSWSGVMADGGGSFGYTIKENLTVSSGKYVWDPTNEIQSLQSAKNRLSEDKDFAFEGFQHGNGSSAGSSSTSEKFAVEGYELIGNVAEIATETLK
ncbi:hypothetical protein AK830_g2073 [Neonectria ditissima]|uniref:Uncharacterized protein n=1 Tax=Neonectria ditissima TaxID=78410 RepID=A0A0P7BSZ2_9HYPO|nr:hypothetical protein AK830_g2073 [Neonectria ditissima]